MKHCIVVLALVAALGIASCTGVSQRQSSRHRSTTFAQDSLIGRYESRDDGERNDAHIAVTISQNGGGYVITFSGAHLDGHGAAPDGEGTGQVGADGVLRFTYEDSFFNRGSGTFRRTEAGYELSIDITDVAEPRCMVFYGNSILRRTE